MINILNLNIVGTFLRNAAMQLEKKVREENTADKAQQSDKLETRWCSNNVSQSHSEFGLA